MEDEPIKPKTTAKSSATKSTAPKTTAPRSTAPKATAPKTSAPKVATPKTASATTPTAPKATTKRATASKTSESVKETVATETATPTAPTASAVRSSQAEEMTTEEAKQAELQSALHSGKGGKDPQKKRTVKKLIFALVFVAVIAVVGVTAAVVVPMLLSNTVEQEINIDLDKNMTFGEKVHNFEDAVTDYQLGDTIERGLSVRNNGNGDVFVCFKVEIYEYQQDEIGYVLDMQAIPTLNSSLWTSSVVVEEINQTGRTANSVYYYYNNLLTKKSGATSSAVLFKEYVINAESAIANQYANQKVTCKVTVKFVNANVTNLSSQADACWNTAPESWKGIMRSKIDK